MRKLLILLLGITMLGNQLAAQERTISGKVTDANGTGIPNVSVLVKGTSYGTTSKEDGSFSLKISAAARVLIFTSVGQAAQEVSIGNKGIINVSLLASDKGLQEVVVVGYGSQKKSNLTSAVVKVGGDKLENVPVPSVDAMLQGKVAGLQSVGYSGQPGANQQVRIRGIGSTSSISASQPLYVVDGVQINSGDVANSNSNTGFNINPSTNVLATMNSNDIESVTVLKDAAATSIYGARGANGVIIITTKSGKSGKTQFRFDTEIGQSKLLEMPVNGRPLRTDQWMTLLKEGQVNAGLSQATIDANMTAYGFGSGLDIDWMKLITRSGTQQQYNVSASGGDQKTRFFVSGGYFKQQGATIGTDLNRYSTNIKITNNPTTRLSFTTKLNIGYVVQHSALAAGGQQGGSGGGYFGNPQYVALTLRPTQNPYNPDGTFNISTTSNFGFPSHFNPLYIAANDKRWLKVVEDIYNWHYRNEAYLRNEFPLARVGLVYSQQTATFYGGTRAQQKVEDHTLGFYHALIEARTPFEMVHDRLLDPEHTNQFKLLILPNIAALSDKQCDQIRAFVKRGGSLLATFETSLYDEWGVRRQNFGLSDLFGAKFKGRVEGPMQNSYLNLDQDSTGKRHPLLAGLEDTPRIINGVWRVEVERNETGLFAPLTLIPSYPDLPMEMVYPRVPRTDIPGVYLSEAGRGEAGQSRVVYFPWDIDRTFWEVMSVDHGQLLRNAVHWALNEDPVVTVTGPGILDVTVWRQKDSMTVHLVNLTNPMMMKGPIREFVPTPPQNVTVRLPNGRKPRKVPATASASACACS